MNTLTRKEQFAMAAMKALILSKVIEAQSFTETGYWAAKYADALEAALDPTEKKDVESAPMSTLATLSRDFILEQQAHAETAAKLKSTECKIANAVAECERQMATQGRAWPLEAFMTIKHLLEFP